MNVVEMNFHSLKLINIFEIDMLDKAELMMKSTFVLLRYYIFHFDYIWVSKNVHEDVNRKRVFCEHRRLLEGVHNVERMIYMVNTFEYRSYFHKHQHHKQHNRMEMSRFVFVLATFWKIVLTEKIFSLSLFILFIYY